MLTWIKGLFTNSPAANLGRVEPADPFPSRADHRSRLGPSPDEPQVFSFRIVVPSNSQSGEKAGVSSLRRRKSEVLLDELDLFDAAQLRLFNKLELVTVGDLSRVRLSELKQQGGVSKDELRWLRSGKALVQTFIKIRALRILDIRLLQAVHRGSVSAIASEHPIRLFRDIQRLVLSTKGQHLLNQQTPPSLERVTGWKLAADKAARR